MFPQLILSSATKDNIAHTAIDSQYTQRLAKLSVILAGLDPESSQTRPCLTACVLYQESRLKGVGMLAKCFDRLHW